MNTWKSEGHENGKSITLVYIRLFTKFLASFNSLSACWMNGCYGEKELKRMRHTEKVTQCSQEKHKDTRCVHVRTLTHTHTHTTDSSLKQINHRAQEGCG